MTLEEYLIEVHEKQYIGLDDERRDNFKEWIQDLIYDEWIEYAQRWHNNILLRISEDFNHVTFCKCALCKAIDWYYDNGGE